MYIHASPTIWGEGRGTGQFPVGGLVSDGCAASSHCRCVVRLRSARHSFLRDPLRAALSTADAATPARAALRPWRPGCHPRTGAASKPGCAPVTIVSFVRQPLLFELPQLFVGHGIPLTRQSTHLGGAHADPGANFRGCALLGRVVASPTASALRCVWKGHVDGPGAGRSDLRRLAESDRRPAKSRRRRARA